MTKTKTTKRALVSSIVALFVCFTMLLGTTYAWFTDSAVSANNKIEAGTLDVSLLLWDGTQYVDISENEAPIFGTAGLAQNSLNTLWEPGKTQVAYLAIANKGTLDLQYCVNISVTSYTKNLYEVMEYDIIPNVSNGTGVTEWTDGTSVVPGNNKTQAEEVALDANVTHYFALAVHMDENAENEYQGGEITFDINVLATQRASESDSFGNTYDAGATFPNFGSASEIVDGSKTVYDLTVYDTQVEGDNNKQKIGYASVPQDALVDGAENVSYTVKKQDTVDSNVTVLANENAMTYEVSVSNLKANNDVLVKAAIRIGEGYTGLKLFHNDVEIPEYPSTNAAGEYYIYSGEYIEIVTTYFSPFTVVYSKEAMVLPPVEDVIPVAIVEKLDPVPTIEKWETHFAVPASTTQQLDAVYSFKAPQGEVGEYENWLCDYYVMFDSDKMDTLPEGSITLGGNYGAFGWNGFDNPEVATKTFIPLLGSVMGGDTDTDGVNTYWTYERVRGLVDTFICGVAKADGCTDEVNFEGATFVVELRITNPEDHSDYIAVNTVTYDFTTGESVIENYSAQ